MNLKFLSWRAATAAAALALWALMAASAIALADEGGDEASQGDTLCAWDETVYFSCVMKESEKLLSLCGSRLLDSPGAFLIYRFGVPGGIELEYPKARRNSLARFRFSNATQAGAAFRKVEFSIGPYAYRVYDDLMSDQDSTLEARGVAVALPDGRYVDMVCDPGGVSRLGSLANSSWIGK